MGTDRCRALLATIAVVAASLAAAGTAAALVDLADVAASDVAVESSAAVSAEARAALDTAAAELRAAGTPVKFVILGTRPRDPLGYAQALRSRLSFGGEVLVLSERPRNLAIASPLPSQTAQRAYEARLPDLRADPVAGTIAVARDLAAQRGQAGPADAAPVAPGGRDGSGGGAAVLLLPMLLVLGGVVLLPLLLLRRARSRAADAEAAPGAVEADARALDPLVDALAAQITDLDDDAAMAGDRTAAVREHYDEAVLAYGEARTALGQPRPTAAQVAAAGAALERGLRAARRTRAVLEGRRPADADREPLLEGMCAFDPKHGRATDVVEIRTPAGDRAGLPACRACADAMARGEEPRFREVEQSGRLVPYWQTRGLGMRDGAIGGGFGPLLGGALAGMILGGMLGGGQADASDGGGWGGAAGGDLGDIGGGDFGDFGGGGGGDF